MVDWNYQPLIFRDTAQLNTLLRNNILINQTSIPLSNEMIEILCLGLNFIPGTNLNSTLDQPIERLKKDINTRLFFAKKTNNKFRYRGWLSPYIKSEWIPEQQTCLLDKLVLDALDGLNTAGLYLQKPSVNVISKILRIISSLKKRTDIHILKSDKGRNTVLWMLSDYENEANRQLNDVSTYRELSKKDFESQLLSITSRCQTISENLLALNLISAVEDSTICKTPPRGSSIYFLPKIHKEKEKTSETFPGRPIVATFTSVTYLLDKYITVITSHILPLIPGSVKDTNHFIRTLPTSKLPEGTRLITADVNSLYPNTPWEEGIFASTQFYKKNFKLLTQIALDKKQFPPPPPRLFKEILTLVLCNSMIEFKNKRFFHQIKGTAMGCCISVYFANCYM